MLRFGRRRCCALAVVDAVLWTNAPLILVEFSRLKPVNVYQELVNSRYSKAKGQNQVSSQPELQSPPYSQTQQPTDSSSKEQNGNQPDNSQ